jgi:hypothetical protein
MGRAVLMFNPPFCDHYKGAKVSFGNFGLSKA